MRSKCGARRRSTGAGGRVRSRAPLRHENANGPVIRAHSRSRGQSNTALMADETLGALPRSSPWADAWPDTLAASVSAPGVPLLSAMPTAAAQFWRLTCTGTCARARLSDGQALTRASAPATPRWQCSRGGASTPPGIIRPSSIGAAATRGARSSSWRHPTSADCCSNTATTSPTRPTSMASRSAAQSPSARSTPCPIRRSTRAQPGSWSNSQLDARADPSDLPVAPWTGLPTGRRFHLPHPLETVDPYGH